MSRLVYFGNSEMRVDLKTKQNPSRIKLIRYDATILLILRLEKYMSI